MKNPRLLKIFGVSFLVFSFGCEGPRGPEGPQGPSGSLTDASDISCSECHNNTSLISGKQASWAESEHGNGQAYVRGTRSSCAGCHSGAAFTEMVLDGQHPGNVESGDPEPTRQDCRTCHQIHTTNTAADWALTTTAPVELYAIEGATYDGGEGNLCVVCHQPRRTIADAVDGEINITSTHWGPHHGGQGSMVLGVAGAGATGNPGAHYNLVDGTCVTCHLGEGDNHSFEAQLSSCQVCHSGAENFDINGVQTEVQEKLDQLEEGLIALGWLDEEGHPAVTAVPEAQAAALWNWIYIAHEDKSLGVHNPAYTRALLDAGLEAINQ